MCIRDRRGSVISLSVVFLRFAEICEPGRLVRRKITARSPRQRSNPTPQRITDPRSYADRRLAPATEVNPRGRGRAGGLHGCVPGRRRAAGDRRGEGEARKKLSATGRAPRGSRRRKRRRRPPWCPTPSSSAPRPRRGPSPVSYTHLTLPTILRVL